MGMVSPMLRYLREHEITLLLTKVNRGACGSYIGG